MAGFFGKLFGAGKSNETRRLTHPCDLRKGDFVRFGIVSQSEVSGQTFEVYKVNTYRYGSLDYPEMILKDTAGNIIFMMIEEEDGEDYVSLSKKVPKAQIRDLMPQEALDRIFERGTGTQWGLDKEAVPEGFEKWISTKYKYTETDEEQGRFSKGDSRTQELGGDETFKSYNLVDPADEYALEIEVFGQGEIELSTTVYHDINIIEEILPGSLDE